VGSGDPYYSEVRARIQSHIQYTPALARRRLQGEVQVSLTLLPNGSMSALNILHSSGSEELDHLALESVKAALPFPSFPESAPARAMNLPIAFRLH
jgi:TonB family protein